MIRVGSADDPDYAFGPIVDLMPGPDGLLYTMHWGEGTIRRWNLDGTPAGSVGRKGEGPGEFETPLGMGFFGGSMEEPLPRPSRPLRDGTFIGVAPAWSDGIARGTLTETPYVHMDADGSRLARIWSMPHEPRDVFAILSEDGFGGSYSSQPFGDDVWASSGDHGLLVLWRRAWTGEGEASVKLTKIGLDGDTLFAVA